MNHQVQCISSYTGKRGKRCIRRSHKVLSGRSIEDRPLAAEEHSSNENMNGFVRYSIPKGTRIRDWTRQKIQKLNRDINHYPRRMLEGQSAAMVSPQAIMA